jgi:hypothetical protein
MYECLEWIDLIELRWKAMKVGNVSSGAMEGVQQKDENLFRFQVFGVTITSSVLWKIFGIVTAYITFAIQVMVFHRWE